MLRSLFVLGLVLLGAVASLRSAFYTLLFYLWLAYFRPEEWIYDNFLASLNLSFTVGAFLLLTAFFRGAKPLVNRRVLLFGVYLAVCAGSTSSSKYADMSGFFLTQFTKAILVTFTMISLTRDVARLRIVLITIGLSLGFETAKQGWANLILHPGAINTNEISFLGDNNCVAVGMMLLTALLVSLAETSTKRWERWLFLWLAVGVAYRGISTYSRGGLLGFATVAFMYWVRSKNKVTVLLAIALVAGVISQVLPPEFYERMGTIKADDQGQRDWSAASRLHFWQVAVKMATARPLGVGFNAYVFAYDDFDFLKGEYGRSRAVHSSWFGVIGELGWIGFVLFTAIYLLALRGCYRVGRLARHSENPDLVQLAKLARGLETGLAGFAVGGAFVPWHNVEMLWHWFGLTIVVEALADDAARREAFEAHDHAQAIAEATTTPSQMPHSDERIETVESEQDRG